MCSVWAGLTLVQENEGWNAKFVHLSIIFAQYALKSQTLHSALSVELDMPRQ